MEAFTRLDAKIAPLAESNIDTDQIIPKQFLKTVEREGLGAGLFYDLRFDGEGKLKPDFVLNRPEYKGTGVLVAGDNFGCGSSREHAPWALMDFGIRLRDLAAASRISSTTIATRTASCPWCCSPTRCRR